MFLDFLIASLVGSFIVGIVLVLLKRDISDSSPYKLIYKDGFYYHAKKYTFKESVIDILIGICGVIAGLSFIILMIIL